MKRLIILLTMLLICNLVIAQDKIVVLHPIVGDTIDQKEKIDFILFPNIVDSSFHYGQVHNLNNKYYLYSYLSTDSIITQLDSSEIHHYYVKIKKLSAYYSNILTPDSGKKSTSIMFNNKNNNNKTINEDIMNPYILNKTLKDANRIQLLNNSADRQGLTGKDKENYINTGGAGSISLKKKK